MYTELLNAVNGFEFLVKERGDHAIVAARDWQPDVIVMDVRLPMLDGVSAIHSIREFDKDTPIIVITAYTDADTISRALAAGATTIFTKPFPYHTLKKTIYNLYVPREKRIQGESEKKILLNKYLRLGILQEKQAFFGMSTPAEIIAEIQELKRELGQ